MKLSQLGWIYHVTGHVTNQMIIRFMTLHLPILLNASSNKHIGI